MKGLLIKDAILIKKYCILNFAISVLFFAISVMDPENILFALVSVVLISLIPITINAYDEQFKWNLFEAALPINRKTVVLEKYALLLILVLPVTVIYSLIGLIFNDFSFEEFLFNWSVMLFTGIITPCVTIPILLKFGYIKSRVISIVVIILFAAGGCCKHRRSCGDSHKHFRPGSVDSDSCIGSDRVYFLSDLKRHLRKKRILKTKMPHGRKP